MGPSTKYTLRQSTMSTLGPSKKATIWTVNNVDRIGTVHSLADSNETVENSVMVDLHVYVVETCQLRYRTPYNHFF